MKQNSKLNGCGFTAQVWDPSIVVIAYTLLPYHMLLLPPSLGMDFVLLVLPKNHSPFLSLSPTQTHTYTHPYRVLFDFDGVFELYKNDTPCMVCWDLLFLFNI